MPDLQQFRMPDVGEGLTEAEILAWHVAPGDTVTVNQVIVEIETAKASVELPCPYAGVVTELLVEPGSTVNVGTPIISIDQDRSGAAAAPAAPAEAGARSEQSGMIDEETDGGQVATLVGYGPRSTSTKPRRRKGPVPSSPVPASPPPAEPPSASTATAVPLAKPPVRKLARELGVDLRALSGSGPGGVITRDDVQRAAEPPTNGAASPAAGARERRVPVRGVRRATAQAMVDSAFTAPHVTEFLTVDVTPTMELRDRLRSTPEFREVKLSPLAFVARALCLAVRRTPEVNARWDGAAEEIVYPDYVHLGIAAATPRGLVVPKIRDADRMSLRELAEALEALTSTAREGRTPPEEMLGGTITITNIGVFGVDTGTPIINPGESAILAVGAVRDMPWVVDGAVVPRKVCQLAVSFDHRVVDGQQGSQFLADVGALLADPALAITW